MRTKEEILQAVEAMTTYTLENKTREDRHIMVQNQLTGALLEVLIDIRDELHEKGSHLTIVNNPIEEEGIPF
jgi:hypothetical protein